MIIVLVMTAAFLFVPTDALAWGTGAHLFISQNVVDALLLDGPSNLSSLIVRNYAAFALGNIMPDVLAFRDWFSKSPAPFIHDWATAHRLLKSARKEEEAAFSLGYLSHLSSDVICHNFFIPGFIFMWDHRLKITHIIAESQVEGYIGHPWPHDEVAGLLRHNQRLNEFFIITAGLGMKEFERHSAFIEKAMSFKVKCGIDNFAFNISANKNAFTERTDHHIRLSVNLSVDTLKKPFNSDSLNYCPEGEKRMNLSRIRRRLFIRLKSIKSFRKHREEGKFDYIHRVPGNLTTGV